MRIILTADQKLGKKYDILDVSEDLALKLSSLRLAWADTSSMRRRLKNVKLNDLTSSPSA